MSFILNEVKIIYKRKYNFYSLVPNYCYYSPRRLLIPQCTYHNAKETIQDVTSKVQYAKGTTPKGQLQNAF